MITNIEKPGVRGDTEDEVERGRFYEEFCKSMFIATDITEMSSIVSR